MMAYRSWYEASTEDKRKRWSEGLNEVDIKYRLLRQVDTHSTKWADSIYTSNPDEVEKTVIRTENTKIIKDKANDMRIGKREKKFRKQPK